MFRKPPNPTFPALLCLWLLLIGLTLVTARGARALDSSKDLRQCRLDSWSTKDGLPPRTIRAIAQTPDGYLWLATDGGLVRFDGVSFHIYNSLNTPGLSRDTITSLMTDRDGTLWVGTNGSGFGTFSHGTFHRLDDDGDRWSETDAICQARDGSIWFGGNGDHRLSVISHGVLRHVWPKSANSSNSPCTGISTDAQGNMWVTTTNNGLILEPASGHERRYTLKDGLPEFSLTCSCRGADGSLWIGTAQSGLCRFQGGRFHLYTVRDGLPSNWIQAAFVDHEGKLWVGTREGLASLRDGRFVPFQEVNGLCDNNVQSIFEDHEGDLWVAAGTGVTRFADTKLTPLTLRAPDGSLAKPTGICRTPDGSLWFATDSGLQRLAHGRFTTLTTKNGLPTDVLTALCAGPHGGVWTLTQGGALVYVRGGRALVAARSNPRVETWALIARDHRDVVLSYHGRIARWDGHTLTAIHSFADPNSSYIFSWITDRQGTAWFASSNGLGEVVGDTTRIFQAGLPPQAKVLCVTQGNDNSLWVGTDRGLARFQNGRFTVYRIRDGLPDENIFEVAEDAQGTLWVGSERGIYTVSVSQLNAYDRHAIRSIPTVLYTASDGVHSFPTTIASVRSPNGDIWFAGQDGLTLISPKHLYYNALPPPVVIEQASANGRCIIRDGVGQSPGAIRVPPGSGSLEVHYTAPSFVAPEKVLFRYQLVGYDAHWVNAGTRREAYYTNLPPGKYRFRVQACNNDGVWSRGCALFDVTLTPHYYETGWFHVLDVSLALMVLAALYLIRTQHLRRRNHELEAYATERTAELVQAVNTLQKTTVELATSNGEREAVEEELRAQNEELIATHELLEVQNRSLLKANLRLEALATTDPLTGLPNHRAMMEAIEAATERAVGECPYALLFLDIDHFKSLNDTFGHPAGDAALQEFTGVVRGTLRGQDILGRWGGEEFVALLPGTDGAGALVAAEHIRARVASHMFALAGGLRLTCSVGTAAFPADALERDELLAAADSAMYAAKRLGRNQVRGASDSAVQAIRREKDQGDSREETALTGIVQALTALSGARHGGLMEHAQNVALLAVQIADVLEMPGAEARQIGLAARLHNIGLAAVPDVILAKPARLTAEERDQVRQHPDIGAEIISHVPALRALAPIVHAHHERWDGGGYPRGLAGTTIPLGARILAVADAYCAITSPRSYRQARTSSKALAELQRCAGGQFDPEIVSALTQVLAAVPAPAAWPQGRYANSTFPLSPIAPL